MAYFDESQIMSDDYVESLFTDNNEGGEQEPPIEEKKTPEKKNTTEEEPPQVDPETLFDDETTPESVGSDKDNKEKKDTTSGGATSPTVLSSLAKALKEEGIFLDLAEEDIATIKDADSFKEAIEKQIKSQLDERQRRIDEALGNGVEPDVIRRYENTLAQLNHITEDQLKSEGTQAENLRKYILKQDYLNRNYTPEQAERMVSRAISAGTDVEDAIEALASIKTNVQKQYDAALEDARKQEEADKNQRKEEAAKLRKGIMEDKTFFGDLELPQSTRQKALDNLIKPIWKDPETGETFTAIQKYERDNHVEFLQKLSIIFTLTDGLKSLDGLIGGKVTKAVNKGFQELEHTLNNTQRNPDGTLNFASGVDDENSFLDGISLDV